MTLIDVLLALAPLLVVPLALRLVVLEAPLARRLVGVTIRVQPAGAVAAAVSVFLGSGRVAGVLATVWFLCTVPAAFGGLAELLAGRRDIPGFVGAAGLGYLSFGAGWLVISRLGIRPLGFPPVIVELTAVHFHYTGLAVAALAQQVVLAARDWRRGRLVASAAAAALVAGSPITAAGFTVASAPLQMVGVAMIASSVMVLAVLTLLVSRRVMGTPAVWLVRVSAWSVFLPMPLALDFTLAKLVPIPALGIQAMAAVHGSVNALVFCLVGLVGWLAMRRTGTAFSPDAVSPRRA